MTAARRTAVETRPQPASRTLSTELFEQLRDDILHCRLAPDERLRFKDLRDRYDTGLSPLREALMRLVAEGLVVLADHKGFRVAPVSPEEMLDIAQTLLELEAIGLRWAIEKGDDRWEANIIARFHELSKRPIFAADGSLDPEWEARNVAFHQSLYASCGSPSLIGCCQQLSERFARYRRLRTRKIDSTRDIAAEHEGIMRAVLGRDAATAIQLLREHRSLTTADIKARWKI